MLPHWFDDKLGNRNVLACEVLSYPVLAASAYSRRTGGGSIRDPSARCQLLDQRVDRFGHTHREREIILIDGDEHADVPHRRKGEVG